MSPTVTAQYRRQEASHQEPTTPSSFAPSHAGDHERVYLPTPEEIAAECKRIRDSWSRNEQHRRRAGVTETDYTESDHAECDQTESEPSVSDYSEV